MASKSLELTLEWENQKEFKFSSKPKDGEKTLVVKVEENGHIKDIWPFIESACIKFFQSQIETIGKEMLS